MDAGVTSEAVGTPSGAAQHRPADRGRRARARSRGGRRARGSCARAPGAKPPSPDRGLPHPKVGDHTAASLAFEVWPLTPDPRLHPWDRERVALHVDRLLVLVARGRGALDLAIGELLRRLERLERVVEVGYATAVDYAREGLGLPGREVMDLLRLAEACETRPLLRAAVWSGALSALKAQVIRPVAVGEDEARWVALAQRVTLRQLKEQVKAALEGTTTDPRDDPEAPWGGLRVRGTDAQFQMFAETVELGRRKEGPRTSEAECVRMIGMEVASSGIVLDDDEDEDADEASGAPARPAKKKREGRGIASHIWWPNPAWASAWNAQRRAQLRRDLEAMTQRWRFLDHDVPRVAGAPVSQATDPHALDTELRLLVRARRDWDLMAGRLAYLIRRYRLWRDLQFASFEHYAQERLQVTPSVLHERANLEFRMFFRPELREALESGRLSYSKVVLLARAEERIPLDWAALHTVQELKKRVETREREAMKDRKTLVLKLPQDTLELIDACVKALQSQADRWLGPGEAWWELVAHAHGVWSGDVRPLGGQDGRLYARKGGLCDSPGCTVPAAARHHVHFRSQGGGDADDNKVLLCRRHHDAVHAGTFNVIALGGLTFEWHIGCRWGDPPRQIVATKDGEVIRREVPRPRT